MWQVAVCTSWCFLVGWPCTADASDMSFSGLRLAGEDHVGGPLPSPPCGRPLRMRSM